MIDSSHKDFMSYMVPEEAVEYLRQRVFSGLVPSSIAYGELLRHDVVEHGMGGCSMAGRSHVSLSSPR